MQKVRVSICIVSFKDYERLNKCLLSIYRYKPAVSFEVIVVDNDEAKEDVPSFLKKYKKLKYIRARRNGGYGAGNNLAISNSTGEFVLVLNPDTRLQKNTINFLYNFMLSHKNAACVGCAYQRTGSRKVALGAGKLTPIRGIFALSFLNKLFPNNYFSKKYYLDEKTRKSGTKVWAVAGSLGLFRKKALTQVKGYDEKLFLYYEESDLGKRLIEKGWELWITPKAHVYHEIAGSTSKVNQNKIINIFLKSRIYYFKKHYGLVAALLVEAFARFGKWEMAILLVTILGLFLRVFRLSDNLVFHGELGDNYLAMKNILTTGVIPLLGPQTSHPWLFFGPLFYWIFTPVLLISRFDPQVMACVYAIFGAIVILVNYFVISGLFTKKIAVISSFLISLSPMLLYFAREARFFSLVVLLFYPLLAALLSKKYFWAGIWLGVILNFHLSPLLYIPVVLTYIFLSKNSLLKLRAFLTGAIVPSIPFTISSLFLGGNLTSTILWVPYRILGFLGVMDKNNFNAEVAAKNAQSLGAFLNSLVLHNKLYLVVLILSLVFFLKKGKAHKNSNTILLFIVFGFVGVFIHGDAPIHYYLPLIIPILLYISIVLSRLNKFLLLILGILMIGVNFSYFFSNQWFYIDQSIYSQRHSVPYALQIEASKTIATDAKGYPFSLKRVGPWDNFDKNYAQNYIYLLWRFGSEPRDNQILTYTIYEGEIPQNKKEEIIFNKGGIIVSR